MEFETTIEKQSNLDAEEISTQSWGLWSATATETTSVQQAVEEIFSQYSFYPEVEWKRYGYFPPDGHKVLGAWRHPDAFSFVFLLDNPGMTPPNGAQRVLLFYAGRKAELAPIQPKIERLRRELVRKNGHRESVEQLYKRLQRADKSGAAKRLIALMGVIAAAVNGLALYFRKLPPPPAMDLMWLSVAYKSLLQMVYISSLALLFAFIVLCLAYICKYGLLLVRRI